MLLKKNSAWALPLYTSHVLGLHPFCTFYFYYIYMIGVSMDMGDGDHGVPPRKLLIHQSCFDLHHTYVNENTHCYVSQKFIYLFLISNKILLKIKNYLM